MTKNSKLDAVDILLIVLMVLPFIAAIALKVIFSPASEGMSLSGALVFCTIPMPILGDLLITETQVNSWAVILCLFFLCLFLTRKLDPEHPSARQHLAEMIVEKTESLVSESMGEYFKMFAPFICAILGLSALSSLSSLCGLYPATSDLNTTAGWAIVVFVIITYYKLKCGLLYYVKGFTKPIIVLLPVNIISELATPFSMAFRHYGNILAGTVISTLIASALQGASRLIFGWLPGFLGDFPFLQVGIPAVFSIYFDVFSGCLQAFIFAMLTMMFVSDGFPMEDYFERKAKKAEKKSKKAAA